jgi:hypothetical protein
MVVDFRCPTVRLRKFVDFFLTRYTRWTFNFSRPTKFKAILENHAPFSRLQALSNEFGELVLRIRSVGSFLRHVLGGQLLLGDGFICRFGSATAKVLRCAGVAFAAGRAAHGQNIAILGFTI